MIEADKREDTVGWACRRWMQFLHKFLYKTPLRDVEPEPIKSGKTVRRLDTEWDDDIVLQPQPPRPESFNQNSLLPVVGVWSNIIQRKDAVSLRLQFNYMLFQLGHYVFVCVIHESIGLSGWRPNSLSWP